MDTFNLLSNPDDILKRIVDFLPLKDAINFYSTNKRLRSFLYSGNRFQIVLYCEQESFSKRSEFLPGKLPDHFRNHPQLLSNVQKFVYAIDKKEKNINYLKELFTMLPNVKYFVAAALESTSIHPSLFKMIPTSVTSLELSTNRIAGFKLKQLTFLTSLNIIWIEDEEVEFPPNLESLFLSALNTSINSKCIQSLPLKTLFISNTLIDLENIPTSIKFLELMHASSKSTQYLTRLSKLENLTCSFSNQISLDPLPISLTSLSIKNNFFGNACIPSNFPPSITNLHIEGKLPPILQFPASLTDLTIASREIPKSIRIPENIISLSLILGNNGISKNLFGSNVKRLKLINAHIKKKSIHDLPLSLQYLSIGANYISKKYIEELIKILETQNRTLTINLTHYSNSKKSPNRTYYWDIFEGKQFNYVKELDYDDISELSSEESNEEAEGEYTSDSDEYSEIEDSEDDESSSPSREAKRRKLDEDWEF